MLERIERFHRSFLNPKTEENDTHDYINRHDPEYEKRYRQPRDPIPDSVFDDVISVSVESLIIFLRGLLIYDDIDPDSSSEEASSAHDPMRDRAIQAYEAHLPHSGRPTPHHTDLEGEDMDPKLIRSLIQKLQALLLRDIDHITLTRGEGFLDSVEKAVEKIDAV